MISDEFDYSKILSEPNFVVKKYKYSIYRGQIKIDAESKKRSGYGVIVYENGRVYEGQWENDKRHGHGYEIFPDKNTYHGWYSNGKAEG